MQIEVNLGNSSFAWTVENGIDASVSLSSDSNCQFSQFLKISKNTSFSLFDEKYAKMTEHFVSSSHVTPLLMPRHLLKEKFQAAESVMSESLSSPIDSSYFQTWIKISDFLSSLNRAKIDEKCLKSLMVSLEKDEHGNLGTFLPQPDGYAKKVIYSTADSLTGRAKVISGPQILTAPHEVRKCIRSSFDGGKILMVDFTSIEPRIALFTVGKPAPEDVYADLMEEFENVDRRAAKLATLVTLYGGKLNRLSEVLGDIGKARKAVSFVKSNFRVDALERKLQEQADSGLVRNIFGRPLREATKNPRIRTNHYLQSSAAELSPLLFAGLCEKFAGKVRPLFVIHDALIVDVPPGSVDSFIQESNSIYWNGNAIPVKIETLSPHT